MRLFRRDGEALGEVIGPRRTGPAGVGIEQSDIVSPVAPPDAFGAGIRMANGYDCELVVTGDISLWEPRWGLLAGDTYFSPHRPEHASSAA